MGQQSFEDKNFAGPFRSGNSRDRNYGGKIGFNGDVYKLHINANGSYIADIRDANYISAAFNFLNQEGRDFFFFNFLFNNQFFTLERSDGIALHGDVRYGPFALGGDYVTALHKLNSFVSNSKIRAWGVDGSVDFNIPFIHCPSTLAVGYQGAADTNVFRTRIIGPIPAPPLPGPIDVGNILPRRRFITSYTVRVSTLAISAEWVNDKDFGPLDGGRADSSNLGILRISAEL